LYLSGRDEVRNQEGLMGAQFAEMLLDLKYRGKEDVYRKGHPFAESVEATHAILFNSKYSRLRKIAAYRKWLETEQPCVFGRVAAKQKRVFICLIEEQEVLRMEHGDEDLRDTIQDYRQIWKRYALEGLNSAFLVLFTSRALLFKAPDERLKEICRRLLELYMEVSPIPDDTILPQREYVFLRHFGGLLKFSTLPNIFCAQGDGRWWQDHRTPGGVMITSNALGHFVYSRTQASLLQEKDKLGSLENAMRTIHNAYKPRRVGRGAHALCPATRLVPLAPGEFSPLRESSEFKAFSPDHYRGYFHTDHLVPAVFFARPEELSSPTVYDPLSFRYIFDSQADPREHEELMTGVAANWFDVRRNLDRLPEYANPENGRDFTEVTRGRLAHWAAERLQRRLA
jgi:hypothetical protein